MQSEVTVSPTTLDYSAIPDVSAAMLTLYQPSPVFYEKDFREIIRRLCAGASKVARRLLQAEVAPESAAFQIEWEERLQLVFDGNLLPKTISVWDKKGKPKILRDFKLEYLVELLLHWETDSLRHTHASTEALLEIFHFSLALAKNGAFAPELLECSPGKFRIRWLPAVIVPQVGDLFEQLAASLPPDLLTVESNEGERSLPQAEMLNSICSFFFGYCIKEAAWQEQNPLPKMFFFSNENEPVEFSKEKKTDIWALRPPGRKLKAPEPVRPEPPKKKPPPPDVPQQLRHWLHPFSNTPKDYLLTLKTEDLSGSFSVEFLVEFRPEPQRPPVPLSHIFKQKKYEAEKQEMLPELNRMAEFFPKLNSLFLESKGEQRLVFNETQFVEILLNVLPALELLGIRLLLPEGLMSPIRPHASLLVKKAPDKAEGSPSGNGGSFSRPEDLFTFEWQVALGERFLPVGEFEKSVVNLNGVVKIKDEYVLINEDDLIRLFQQFDRPPPPLAGFEALQILLSEEWQGVKIAFTEEAATLLRQLTEPPETPLPEGLKAKLRPCQLAGYDWLMKNVRLGFGSLLADDLGLGKSLQVIAALLRFKEEGFLDKKKALVIVPAPLLVHWRKEIAHFAPSLVSAIYYGNKRPLGVHNPDVIITSYGVAHSEVELLKKLDWYCTVADEAQHLKNAESDPVNSVKALAAPVRIALCNRLSTDNDLVWGILDFTNKGYLGSHPLFTGAFYHPIRREHNWQQAELLEKMTAPFILCRRKFDKGILADLRELGDHDLFAALQPEQATAYQGVVQQNMKSILEEREGPRRRTLTQKMVHALRQVCNHPHSFSKKEVALPEQSGKVSLLFHLLDNIYENREKVLIYTQYKETGELLAQFIAANYDKEVPFLHDNTLRPSRDRILNAFQHSENADTLIFSLHGGGTGMSLNATAHFVHFDLWCNPALELHAVERAFSPNHRKKVMVWRLITQGVFEEKMDEWLKSEPDFRRLTAADGENWVGNLTNEELKDLIN